MSESEQTVRVLVVDDSSAARHLLSELLADDSSIALVGESEDVIDLVEQVGRTAADVVVLDRGRATWDELAAVVRRLRAEHPGTAVVLHSGFPAAELERRSTALGAAAWVQKDEPIAALADAIRRSTRSPGGFS